MVRAEPRISKKLQSSLCPLKDVQPVTAAIDLTDDPYYGEYNNKLWRSKKEKGTNLFYTYASLRAVGEGRRITIFEIPVYQLDDRASIVEAWSSHAQYIGCGSHLRKIMILPFVSTE